MSLILAPMEGVVDFHMRQLLSQLGGFDLCVTEFIRVVDQTLPNRVFYRLCPELHQGGKTQAGTPVRVQLLGQEPDYLASNAVKAIELGSHGIDLNFGCPAKTVNKNKGGAVLLKEPEHMYRIIKAVRDAVDDTHCVSAKIRLGFDDTSLTDEIVDAVYHAGASSLAIHARTKRDGYRPPAYWDKIAPYINKYPMPIVANGEVWQVADYHNCVDQSGTSSVMLGRGALARPDLAKQIACDINNTPYTPMTWRTLIGHILSSSMHSDGGNSEKYFSSRTKQWLGYLRLGYVEADVLFEKVKRLKSKEAMLEALVQEAQGQL